MNINIAIKLNLLLLNEQFNIITYRDLNDIDISWYRSIIIMILRAYSPLIFMNNDDEKSGTYKL